jgi:hypothetical protein
MSGRRVQIRVFLVMAVLLVGLSAAGLGCSAVTVKTGELRTDTTTVGLGAAKSASVEIRQGAGTLKVSGGASKLMDATFVYNVDSWKPEVTYTVNGDQGSLVVRQPSTLNVSLGGQRYEWDLRLAEGVPMRLVVGLGAGKSTLLLGTLTLTALDVESGAGDVTVDLGGYKAGSFEGTIKGGAGRLTVLLPKDVGVSVRTGTALGKTTILGLKQQGEDYVNDAFGKATETVRLTVQAAVGEVNLEVAP